MIELVSAEDANLPRAQRHTDRELGELVGESDRAEYMRQARSRQANMFAQSDLAGDIIDVRVKMAPSSRVVWPREQDLRT